MSDWVPRLSDDELATRFAEIAPPLGRDAARAEADRCLFCYDAPCTAACPTHIDVPAFIKKIATDNLRGSARVILEANPFGHSCARACPVEVLCEGACVFHARGESPISIALLQRHATDYVLDHGIALFHPGPDSGHRVAIVGAGPAGLSCARELRRMGHAVTCFEGKDHPGGLSTYGIAEYKLRPDTALAEVEDIVRLGVTVRTGVAVGRDVAFDQLLADYDAVFVAIGLPAPRRLGIPNEDIAGVVDALQFIADLKMRPYRESRVGREVLVVGGGNTAIDAVTQAKRLGADHATIVYRRGEADMPCYAYEYELAKGDGCGFRFHATPVAVVGGDRVEGLEVDTPAGREVLSCDMIIRATGQEATTWFTLPADHPKVFLGGDFANGGAELVHAAAEGMAVAHSIDALLREAPGGHDG